VNLLTYFCFSFVAGFLARRADVVVVLTDPPVLGLVAVFFARLYRAKLIFSIKDVHPEIGVVLGKIKNRAMIKLLDVCTQGTLARADRVAVLGEDMRRRVLARGYRHDDRIRVTPDWVDTTLVCPQPGSNAFRQQQGLDRLFVVMFSGNLGLSQGLDQVLDVAVSLRDRGDIRFVFIGEGAAKADLVERARREGLQNVMFLPYQPKENLSESLGAADVHLVTLRRGLAGLIVPSKVYGIMAVGGPFIAAVEECSDVARIVREENCGVRVEPDDPAQLAEAIRWAVRHPDELRMMGQHGRQAAVTRFDRRIAVTRFQTMLGELAATERGRGRKA